MSILSECTHLDPPSFIERPQSIESEIGENITMNCVVDSNPKADIIWVFDPIDRVRVSPNFHIEISSPRRHCEIADYI